MAIHKTYCSGSPPLSIVVDEINHNYVGSSRALWVDHFHSLLQYLPLSAMLHVESGDLIDSSPKVHIAANPLQIPCKLAVISADTGVAGVALRHLDKLLSGGAGSPSKICVSIQILKCKF